MAGAYIKDSGDFLKKIGDLGNIPENDILVRTYIIGLLPNLLHMTGFNTLYCKFNCRCYCCYHDFLCVL